MNIHILGIGGTFMGSLAQLIQMLGFKVSGQDSNVYPPMSDLLSAQNINYHQNYTAENIPADADLIIVGNAISRGNPALEYVLDNRLKYTSGPAFLAQYILPKYHVLAVAGTHGKTTTASILSWILECADLRPSFLIGGVPQNFGISARLTNSPYFVIEADEYDTAFCDKRSKFIHYQPQTLIINNLEFDHADIFADLAAIERQFIHLLRTMSQNSMVIYAANNFSIKRVITGDLHSKSQTFGIVDDINNPNQQNINTNWQIRTLKDDYSAFTVLYQHQTLGTVNWQLIGIHNALNALAAIAAAANIGIEPEQAITSLSSFKGVKRRLQQIARIKDVLIFDDFAHHPTAIKTTLEAIKNKYPHKQIIAVIELRSNSMKLGVHNQLLADATKNADYVIWKSSQVINNNDIYCDDLEQIFIKIKQIISQDSCIVIMSNGGFDDIYHKLPSFLEHHLQ